MFFTTISETAKVERALLDGSRRRALVKAKQVVRPHALTLDYVLQHVYWADLYLDKIERIGYDGEGRVEIMKKSWVSEWKILNIVEPLSIMVGTTMTWLCYQRIMIK